MAGSIPAEDMALGTGVGVQLPARRPVSLVSCSVASPPTSPRMGVIEDVKAKLVRYPKARYSETPDSIEVHPADDAGFAVSLQVRGEQFTVFFEGWHEEFGSASEALDCLAFGLSDSCRLSVTYRGATAVKWVVESCENGSWVMDSEVGLLLVPFWRTPIVVHKQNRLIPGVESR